MTATQTTAASLFSTTAASQPQQAGGFFGGLGASNPQPEQPQQPGGLFSRIGTTTAPQQSSTTSGQFASAPGANLLGGSRLQQIAPLGGSLLGGAQSIAQPAAARGLFSGIPSQPAQVNVSQHAQSQHVQSAPNQSAYFDQMLERGKKKNGLESGGFGDLPSLQLGLADIARKARNLGTGGATAAEARAGDPRAYVYLLLANVNCSQF
jgi:nuclear pore complex protein Nup93